MKKLSSEPIFFLFSTFLRFASGYKRTVALYFLMFIVANAILLVAPYVFGVFIKEIQLSGITENNIFYLLFLLSLLFFKEAFFWLFHGPARVIERTIAFHVSVAYRSYLLDGLLHLDLSWHNSHESGDTIDKIRRSVEGLYLFGQNIFQIIQVFVKIFGTTAILLLFSVPISLIVFIFVIASLFIVFQFDKKMLPKNLAINEMDNKASAAFFDALSNVTTVKILHIEKPVAKGVMEQFLKPFEIFKQSIRLNEWKWSSGILLFQCISVVPLGAYIFYKLKTGEKIDAGTVSTLYLYLSDLMFVYFGFGAFYEQLFVFRNSVMNAASIEKAILDKQISNRLVVSFKDSLQIKDFSFSYNAFKKNPLLQIHLKKGEKIALIGASGGGKTSFLKAVHSMMPVCSGTIIADGQSYGEQDFQKVDLSTMLVPQDPEIFSSSIKDNITLGVNYSDESVAKAIDLAEFTNVIPLLPKGLDSMIFEKGVNLSGGQKQRLALSRALLFAANKEILLLDESTSSVDPLTEQRIYKNIFSYYGDKTILVSVHKMNLLKFFDRIIFFENMNIVEEGSFEELMERSSYFKKMVLETV